MVPKFKIHYHNFDRKHALPADKRFLYSQNNKFIFDTLYENSDEQSMGEF